MHRKWLALIIVLTGVIVVMKTPFAYSDTISEIGGGQQSVITVSGPVLFPPFHFYTDDNTTDGMAVDYLRLIANRAGLILKIHPRENWADILNKTRSGEIMMLACAAKTSLREKDLLFSSPYLSFPMVIISRKNAPFISGLMDLTQKKVAFIKKNVTYDRIKNRNINTVPLFVDNTLKALEAVSTGQADAYVENLAAASYLIEKKGFTNLKIAAPSGLDNVDLCFAVNKNFPELFTLLNNGLASLTPDDHATIRNRWLSVRYEYGINAKQVALYIFLVGFVALILVMIFIYWNRKLKREVLEREKTEDALRKSEQRFRDISLNIGDVIWEVDQKGVFTYVSDTISQVGGYESEELIGKTHYDMMDETEAQRFKKMFKIISSESNPIVDTELWYKTRSGTSVCLMTNGIPIIDNDNRVLGFRGVGKDITIQKKLEKEKKRMEDQLKQAMKMETIGTLAGGIAHDFNNILGIIIGNTELAMGETSDWNPIQKNLEEIKNASLRARDVVRQLLGFSRKTELQRKPIKIQDIVSETVALLRSTIPSSIEIKTTVSDKTSPILADATQIHQIILNLCTNAVHAMEENGGLLEIYLSDVILADGQSLADALSKSGKTHWVHLSFRDTGHGIPQAIRERIFDPYFTTKAIGKGTGIGLSVVLGIVKANEGLITIDSEPDHGTTVNLFFPPIESTPEDEQKTPGPLPVGTERILFIDDEKSIGDIVELMLTRLGYSVVTVTNPLDGLDMFSKKPYGFDMIISDMTMPYITGDKLIKKCLAIRKDIPIILCTGFSEAMTTEIACEIGAKKLLDKPLEMRQLAVAVRDALDGK